MIIRNPSLSEFKFRNHTYLNIFAVFLFCSQKLSDCWLEKNIGISIIVRKSLQSSWLIFLLSGANRFIQAASFSSPRLNLSFIDISCFHWSIKEKHIEIPYWYFESEKKNSNSMNGKRLRSDKPNSTQLNNSVKCSEWFPSCLIPASTFSAGKVVILSNTTTITQEQDLNLYIQKFPKREEARQGLISLQYICPILPLTVFLSW